ncbi:hypothetical protein KUTeg_023791 [Tegillarca granosa]|uniref:Uncharacterized protein n=1 Tax=Tegillarca granosa TaxID=220873 RepID=A0ABQ9E5M5_TEGGR|nr:hypothetical protein KUTeg_023791 [Tegillarca granosa]
MSNVKSMFESGKSGSQTTVVRKSVHEEIANVEAGEYENQPVKDPNVVRESDRNIGEELPEVGMAKSRLERFKEIEAHAHTPVTSKKRELTSPERAGPMEYVSEPRMVVEKYEAKVEGGIFENEPQHPEGVVRAGEALEDVKPEQGSAKNLLAKFKQIEETTKSQPAPSPGKRELTPDRTGKVEYVSEPRAVLEKYEGKVEAGIFESQPHQTEVVKSGEAAEEVLPERGTALNLVSRFKQIEKESKSPPSPAGGFKREITPDRTGKVEYVSEPRGKVETYEGVPESGVFESQPQDQPEIVKSGEYAEEVLPEVGFARNVAAKFKEFEKSGGSSPSSTPTRRKEFTPPREEEGKFVAGVLESTPQERPDIVKSSDVNVHVYEEELPERGMARNITEKFRKIQSSPAESPVRSKKEFTPPPQSQAGVFENTPAPSLVVETRAAESGILENQPASRPDLAREHSTEEQELPEQGFAKNMVSKWKQMETESGKQSPSPGGKRKEFTPPRDEPRIKSPLSPKSPAGMNSSVHPNDLPGQYQEQVSPGVYENQPDFREDLARETDTDWAEGLPNKDTTRNLVDKFKHIQADAKAKEETPKPVSRKVGRLF